MMKKNLKLFGLLSVLALLTLVMSCGPDDTPPPDVAVDKFYVTKVGEEPSAETELVAEAVDGPDFGTIERGDFFKAYVYLTAGDYNILQVNGEETVSTFGGTSSTEESVNPECDENNSEITLVSPVTDGGDAFTIATAGLYVVAFDDMTSEITFDRIEAASVIGSAVSSWDDDINMQGIVTASGGSWSVEGLEIESGNGWKVRFNCRWAIDRRIDVTMPFSNDNGYSYFTNFGGVDGSMDNLAAGNIGSNFNFTEAERGVYTVTLTWDPSTGFALTAEKTGDLEPLPDFPEAMYLVGDATSYEWETPGTVEDAIMHKIAGGGDNNGVYWKILSLTAEGGFKLSAEAWATPNLGFAEVTVSADTDTSIPVSEGLNEDGTTNGNISIDTDGIYMVVLDLREDGVHKLSILDAKVYGIGDTYADNGFTEGDAATLYTADFSAGTLTSPALTADGDIRMYAAHPWIPAWWNAEFVPMSGVIEYRNDGPDQERVAGSIGQVITLSFDDNTATIQ